MSQDRARRLATAAVACPQARQRAEPEGRKIVAHGAEPWVAGGRRLPAPERAKQGPPHGFFRPVPGLRRDRRSPSADALGYDLAPYGLGCLKSLRRARNACATSATHFARASTSPGLGMPRCAKRILPSRPIDRKSTRLNSSHLGISYAVF